MRRVFSRCWKGFAALSGILLVAGMALAKPPFRTDPTYLIDSWETDDGLPDNSATAMVQTPDGYLWFGTFNGLVRFDGIKFTVLDSSNTPALPSGAITDLHLTGDGKLWVSTFRGMAVCDGGRWSTLNEQDGWVGNYARTMTSRGNGEMLITTFDGRVMELRGTRFHALPDPPGESGQGYLGYADESGRWWVLQSRFVGCWDGIRWTSTIALPPVHRDELGCARARDGGLWVLCGPELRKYLGEKEIRRTPLRGFQGGFWQMSEDTAGNVWICTFNNGLWRVDPAGELRHWTAETGLSYNAMRFLFEDREQNLWAGTSGGGLMRFKPRRFRSFGVESGLLERVVSSVWPDSAGGVLIATYGKGAFRLDQGGISRVPLPGYTGDTIYTQSVLVDRQGRTWIGSFDAGVWLFDSQGVRRIPIEQSGGANVTALFQDSRGHVWMNGGRAVAVCDGITFRLFTAEQGLPAAGTSCFAEDTTGTLWISNAKGIFRLAGDRFVEVLDGEARPMRNVLCLKSDAEGAIWMGLLDDGLVRWKQGRLSRIGAASGFPVKVVSGIVEDDAGFLWMASDRGVVRTRRSDLNSVADGRSSRLVCQVFDLSDGLPSMECAGGRQPVCARDARGTLWFATSKGVAAIDPAGLRLNQVPPSTQIEELIYHAASSSATEGRISSAAAAPLRIAAPFPARVTLPAGSRRLEVHYTALSLGAPEKVRFQVKLEGGDIDWQDVSDRRVFYYHDLIPGNYVFRVRAANNDALWDETGARLAFTVQPFFWQTLWFRVGVGAMLVASSAGSTWWSVHSRHRRARLKLQRGQRQSAALVSLAVSEAVNSGNLDTAFREITETASRILEVRRVGVWLVDEVEARLRCADIFDGSNAMHAKGMVCAATDLRAYLDSLRSARAIAVPNAMHGSPMIVFSPAGGKPAGVNARLDAAVRLRGRLVGVVCHEHPGAVRVWDDSEVAFAGAIADQVTRALLNAERERTADELRASEERMNLAAEAARLGMWLWNVETAFFWMSEGCRELFAFSAVEDLDYARFLGRIHPEDRATVDHALRNAIATHANYEAEFRILTPNGESRWIGARGRVESAGRTRPVLIRGVFLDITRRKQAELEV
ncbi:MAG: two-component regulator propeller domain-containing protein, partial [Tepidisphaeraceae bacterium]